MANTENNPGAETPQDNPNTAATSTIQGEAKSAIINYLAALEKTAKEFKDSADAAKIASEQNLAGKEMHFEKAEKSVDVYENILNKNANLLAKSMEAANLEVNRNVALATEALKSLDKAKASIQAAKMQLVTADDAAERLWDEVRRDLNTNPLSVLQPLRTQMQRNGLVFDSVVEDYSQKIEASADRMNDALLVISGISAEIKTEDFKRIAQETKALTDAYKTELLANLEFSKEKLKKAHVDLLGASAAANDANYNLELAENGLKNLTDLKTEFGLINETPLPPSSSGSIIEGSCEDLQKKLAASKDNLKNTLAAIAKWETDNLWIETNQDYHKKIKKVNDFPGNIKSSLNNLKKEAGIISGKSKQVFQSELMSIQAYTNKVSTAYNKTIEAINLFKSVGDAVNVITDDNFNKSQIKKVLDAILKSHIDIRTKADETLTLAMEPLKNFLALMNATGEKGLEILIERMKDYATQSKESGENYYKNTSSLVPLNKDEQNQNIVQRDLNVTLISAYEAALKAKKC